MKKIIFVQKQESTNDPVAAFFNKKPPSITKIPSQISKPPSHKNSNDKKINIINEKPAQKMKKHDQITPKIGKKGEYYPTQSTYDNPIASSIRQQKGKMETNYKQNNQSKSKTIIHNEDITNILGSNKTEYKNAHIEVKQDSIQKIKDKQIIQPVKRQNKIIEQGKLQNLNKKIKQLQSRQEQYIRKISELQQKQQKYIKNQQKLLKTQKDLKQATQKSKQSQTLFQKLKQKQIQLKELLNSDTIGYNNKRQIILSNKIKQLKRVNRQLVLKIKNYKGTQLVDLAIQQNREEIIKQLYTVDVDKQLKEEMNIQMEHLLAQLINKLNAYVELRLKQKGEKIGWAIQKKFLAEMVGLSEKISLNYLNYYEICPLPKSNQEAISIYSILQQYKQKNHVKKIIDRFNLNYQLSKQNLQTINTIKTGKEEIVELKNDLAKGKKKKDDKIKMNDYIKILQKRSNFNEILIIQNICQLQLLKEWMTKTISQINQQVTIISKTISQIKDIVQLGQSCKQSLYYYLSTNINLLQTKFPTLKIQLKQMQFNYNQIQKYNIQ